MVCCPRVTTIALRVSANKTVGWTYDLAGNVIETHEDAGDFKDR
jgi:hypothetical protein